MEAVCARNPCARVDGKRKSLVLLVMEAAENNQKLPLSTERAAVHSSAFLHPEKFSQKGNKQTRGFNHYDFHCVCTSGRF